MKLYRSVDRYSSELISLVELNLSELSDSASVCATKGGLFNYNGYWFCKDIDPFKQTKPIKIKRPKVTRRTKTPTDQDIINAVERMTNRLMKQIKEA